MAGILRGEIRWADLNPVRGHEQPGHRPVLILSHDVFNARSGTVIAVALTMIMNRIVLLLGVLDIEPPRGLFTDTTSDASMDRHRIHSLGKTLALGTPAAAAATGLLRR